MQLKRMLGAWLLLTVLLGSSPSEAQVSLSAEAGLLSSYVWRGVTYTNNVVVQPDVSLTVPAGRASFTGTLWANVEAGRYNRFGDISESGGTRSFDLAEIDWTGEVGVPVNDRLKLTVGATGYLFPNDAGLTESQNTVELYGKAELSGVVTPTLSLYYDVGSVDGAYLEGGVSYSLPVSKRVPVTLGALAGLSAGQDADLDAEGNARAESFNFLRNGFTHADLSAAADVTTGAFTISPALHLILTGDDATKSTKVEATPGTGVPRPNRTAAKLWLGVTVGWAR